MEQKAKRIGRFNVVDIVAVILILAAVVFVGWKLAHRGSGGGGEQHLVTVQYVVKAEGVAKELYETCQAHLPSQLMASGALLNGQIESVRQEPYRVLGADGQWVEDPDHVDLYFTVTASVPSGEVLTTKVGEQEVRIGRDDHNLKSEYIEFHNAVIVDAEWTE